MAKTLKEEDLRLNIIVNGDPARKEIGELDRSTKDLASSNRKQTGPMNILGTPTHRKAGAVFLSDIPRDQR